MSKAFAAGEIVKYVGRGFLGFHRSVPEMEFRQEDGFYDAIVKYRGDRLLVRMDEIEKIKELTHKEVSSKGGRAKSEAKTASSRRNASAKRFTKQRFLEYLHRRQEKVQGEWGFSDSNGWAQVHRKGLAANKAYGEFNSILELIESITFMEIFPFGKGRLLDHLKDWLNEASREAAIGDAELRARAGGRTAALGSIIKDIEAKVA